MLLLLLLLLLFNNIVIVTFIIIVIRFQGIGSGFQPSPGCHPGQRTLVTGSSVLDTLQLDMAQLVCGQSSCHHEGAQSASGPASLASSQPSSSYTKTSSDVHLTAPKGNHHMYNTTN